MTPSAAGSSDVFSVTTRSLNLLRPTEFNEVFHRSYHRNLASCQVSGNESFPPLSPLHHLPSSPSPQLLAFSYCHLELCYSSDREWGAEGVTAKQSLESTLTFSGLYRQRLLPAHRRCHHRWVFCFVTAVSGGWVVNVTFWCSQRTVSRVECEIKQGACGKEYVVPVTQR
ncbi:hypothetical protein E2C01_018852 [Portunus trituberculatus]|uniref:Uncharacterized protein n=1 Tax=Portunus trituberculatus TaxID=210409 RepID=A0A5B7DW53_PORTR|nr:hypothetical protein [Portunus trituberculatus]